MRRSERLRQQQRSSHHFSARVHSAESFESRSVDRSASPTQPYRRPERGRNEEREHFRQFLMLLGILIGVALWMFYLAS